jgi:hypothetical protein
MPVKGGEILRLNLFLDSSVQKTSFSRYSWVKVIGTVGGFEKFVSMFILFALNYFTKIDYVAEFVKELFLEK